MVRWCWFGIVLLAGGAFAVTPEDQGREIFAELDRRNSGYQDYLASSEDAAPQAEIKNRRRSVPSRLALTEARSSAMATA